MKAVSDPKDLILGKKYILRNTHREEKLTRTTKVQFLSRGEPCSGMYGCVYYGTPECPVFLSRLLVIGTETIRHICIKRNTPGPTTGDGIIHRELYEYYEVTINKVSEV